MRAKLVRPPKLACRLKVFVNRKLHRILHIFWSNGIFQQSMEKSLYETKHKPRNQNTKMALDTPSAEAQPVPVEQPRIGVPKEATGVEELLIPGNVSL